MYYLLYGKVFIFSIIYITKGVTNEFSKLNFEQIAKGWRYKKITKKGGGVIRNYFEKLQ